MKKNQTILDLQIACNNLESIPDKSIFIYWIQHIFFSFKKKIELTIRIVDETESRLLNMYFLKKNYPTNILSFTFTPPPWINTSLIGDLVICQKVIENEAKINNTSIEKYTAYVVTHGSLHLIGYNHITKKENKIMKNLEKKFMKKFGYTNIEFIKN